MNETPYVIVPPAAERIPFILSIPHNGTEFPDELKEHYVPQFQMELDDTDWFLEQLYDFAPSLGITVIHARYSRWVIDLNREPGSLPLYDDGRLITGLCPTTTFLGEKIYQQPDLEPGPQEINRRLENYFYPYHRKLDELIKQFRSDFGHAIFWDGHSIRRHVETIRPEPFPDFILGDNDGRSASGNTVGKVLGKLRTGGWQVNYNDPFKGGFLTRSKGNPRENVQAMQLEMSKDLYMSNNETIFDTEKAETVKKLLKVTFEDLISRF